MAGGRARFPEVGACSQLAVGLLPGVWDEPSSGRGLSAPSLSFPIKREGPCSYLWVRFLFSCSREKRSDSKDWQPAAVLFWGGLEPPSLEVWENRFDAHLSKVIHVEVILPGERVGES